MRIPPRVVVLGPGLLSYVFIVISDTKLWYVTAESTRSSGRAVKDEVSFIPHTPPLEGRPCANIFVADNGYCINTSLSSSPSSFVSVFIPPNAASFDIWAELSSY